MCIDDYAFRHPSARRERICKRFLFSGDSCREKVFLINISQFEVNDDLELCQVLMHLSKKGLNIKDYRFSFPTLNITVEAGDKCRVPFQVLNKKDVYVEMVKIQEQNQANEEERLQNILSEQVEEEREVYFVNFNEMENENSSQNSQFTEKKSQNRKSKTGRTKEREKVVAEALYKTKQWRYLHERANLSLKNAARMVGISKKTLDDYFLIFRYGEIYGYNFKENLYKKMGHLRTYIKKQPEKIKGRLQTKDVQSFQYVPQPPVQEILPIKKWDKIEGIMQELQGSQSFSFKFQN